MGNKRARTHADNKQEVKHPQKRFYRSRAHSNPLNDTHFKVPAMPAEVEWPRLFPDFCKAEAPSEINSEVRFADVGCGFGGLLVRLSPLYPDTLMLGMELRDKVADYVRERIDALRQEHQGKYTNISCVRTNTQKYLPHYFRKGQLTKMFFLFPDPHFKTANHRRRIISDTLLADYAYLLAPGGMLYTITDVEELGQWMATRLDRHPSFQRLSEEELAADKAAGVLTSATEEGQKVARNEGQTWRAVYRRL
ncbi:hypothetical protein WJX73_004365 [Symbiochloris irregularis]|uniref:tRNA (guanine-N(7)-)-methyltransferase n=1 Tax=Symbiochloris irregularis TaxID=706552 RepID=A0AAW1P7D9_9CHLO